MRDYFDPSLVVKCSMGDICQKLDQYLMTIVEILAVEDNSCVTEYHPFLNMASVPDLVPIALLCDTVHYQFLASIGALYCNFY